MLEAGLWCFTWVCSGGFVLSVTRSQGETQKRKGRGLPKISVGYLLSPGFVNLSCNALNPFSFRGVWYRWNLHNLLQTEVLMQPFVYCLCNSFSFRREKGLCLLWSLKAQGSYPVPYPALPPFQHFDRHGLVHIRSPPCWMCQRNGVLEIMAWQFSRVRKPQLLSLRSLSVWHGKHPLKWPEGHLSCLLLKVFLANVVHRAWRLTRSLPGPWVVGLKRYAGLVCSSIACYGYAQGMCHAGGRQTWSWQQPWKGIPVANSINVIKSIRVQEAELIWFCLPTHGGTEESLKCRAAPM